MQVIELNRNEVNSLIAILNPFLKRYCDPKYASVIKQVLLLVLSGKLTVPYDENVTEEAIIKSPHLFVYDNKQVITDSIENVLIKKGEVFREFFFDNLLKLFRGAYLDSILNSSQVERDRKIVYGEFIINLIDNVSIIEGINVDEYFKFKEHIKKETERLMAMGADSTDAEIDFHYWEHSLEYLKTFEKLLLKYEYIESNPYFKNSFEKFSIARIAEPIQFKGQRPELWYILYKIYDDKLFYKGKPLHAVSSALFEFAGKENTQNAINSGWSKFREQMESVNRDTYIAKKLSKAHKLILELNLPK